MMLKGCFDLKSTELNKVSKGINCSTVVPTSAF